MVEIPWSPMAWMQSCSPAASAPIIRSRIASTGCISSDSSPRVGASANGSKKYAVRAPSEPSAYPLSAPMRSHGDPNARRTPTPANSFQRASRGAA